MSRPLGVTPEMKLTGKQEKCSNPRIGPATGFAGLREEKNAGSLIRISR